MDSRPVGVFDSGVGGLTVLHECLVTMPNEDFVYLGDHARLPYGPRPLEEIRRFAREIGSYLEQQDVKLILVACNAATSAALPRLQEELTVPVVGVITPEAHAAVQMTRNGRVGLLATAATVEAGWWRTATLVAAVALPGPRAPPVLLVRQRAQQPGTLVMASTGLCWMCRAPGDSTAMARSAPALSRARSGGPGNAI